MYNTFLRKIIFASLIFCSGYNLATAATGNAYIYHSTTGHKVKPTSALVNYAKTYFMRYTIDTARHGEIDSKIYQFDINGQCNTGKILYRVNFYVLVNPQIISFPAAKKEIFTEDPNALICYQHDDEDNWNDNFYNCFDAQANSIHLIELGGGGTDPTKYLTCQNNKNAPA